MPKLYITNIFFIKLGIIALDNLMSRYFTFDLVLSQGKTLAGMQILMHMNLRHIADARPRFNAAKHKPPVLTRSDLTKTICLIKKAPL